MTAAQKTQRKNFKEASKLCGVGLSRKARNACMKKALKKGKSR